MKMLWSGTDPATNRLLFRVYAAEIPDTERKLRTRLSHLTALDLLSAALLRDFGIRNGKINRKGLEKPYLLHDSLYMNLSHCKGLAVAAVGRIPLGVDAETPRPVRAHLLPRICTPEECDAVLNADDPEFLFSRLWTLKESYAKFTGEGIALPFSSLGFTPGEKPVFHHPKADQVQFYQILLGNHHAVSLCVPRGEYDINSNGKDDYHAGD